MLIKLYAYRDGLEREVILNTAIKPPIKITIWRRLKMIWSGYLP